MLSSHIFAYFETIFADFETIFADFESWRPFLEGCIAYPRCYILSHSLLEGEAESAIHLSRVPYYIILVMLSIVPRCNRIVSDRRGGESSWRHRQG